MNSIDRPTGASDRSRNTLSTSRSTGTTQNSPSLSPTRGGRRPWTAWQDWVNIGLGAYLMLAPLWTTGAPVGWFVAMGILAIIAGLWAGATGSSSVAEWTQMLTGAALFLSPVFGGFAGANVAAGTAWFIGAAIAVLAVLAMSQNRQHTTSSNTHT